MPLSPRDRIGHYEISSLLGAGGMGEVYRARDTRLGREVAIKVLPSAVSADPERLARFEREATALAALNHPCIAQVYGLENGPGDHQSDRALVMELVEGEDLARRLARGPLPLREALAIARQIADALDGAHSSGIVHRDLKPANVMLRADGSIRVLDFGLAKVVGVTGSDTLPAGSPNSPTMPPLSRDASIVGTVPYMSPEQAKGMAVDRQCDIWAFGCVLYELLVGRAAFAGQSSAEVIAKVIEREPDWSALPRETPREVTLLLRKCLQKNRAHRLRDIADARLDLEDIVAETTTGHTPLLADASASRAHRRVHIAWSITAAAAVIATAALVYYRPGQSLSVPAEVVRLDLSPPRGQTFGPTLLPLMTVSPDGRHVAFVATNGSQLALWVRSLDQPEARRLTGTETQDVGIPFWSSDSRFIAFVADGRLLRTDLDGSPPQMIAKVPNGVEGGSWGANGTILFGTDRTGIQSVPATGGAPVQLTNPTAAERAHHWPKWLPDQKRFLYRSANGVIFVGSVNGDAPKALLEADAKAEFVAPNILLYVQGEDLMAQTFDADRAELLGSPERITDQVRVGNLGRASYSASSAALLYRPQSEGAQVGLQVLDRTDRPVHSPTPGQALSIPLGQIRDFSLSADGSSLAVHAHETNTPNGELWIVDVGRGTMSRLDAGPAHDDHPVWSPDKKRLAVTSNGLALITVGANPVREYIVKQSFPIQPTDWSSDGQWVIYHASPNAENRPDIFAVRPAAGQTPRPLIQTRYSESGGALSPDGRWLAYTSDETGRNEVYVQPFPPDGRKIPISTAGGTGARWGGNRLLYYWAADSRVMRTALQTDRGDTRPGPLEFAFNVPSVSTTFTQRSARIPYALLPAGGYITVMTPPSSSETPLKIILNWQSLLHRR